MTFYRGMLVTPISHDISLGWLAGRTLLGVLLLAAWALKAASPCRASRGRKSLEPR